MDLAKIHEGFCDTTRLRLLHVLGQGPLCVCHFQEILGEPQVKLSKHLAYLRKRGLVEVEREGNWMVYALPARPSRELKANLACLTACAEGKPPFQRDLARLKKWARTWPNRGRPPVPATAAAETKRDTLTKTVHENT